MKKLQETRRKLTSNGIQSRDMSDVARILKVNTNLIVGKLKCRAVEGKPPVAQPAPRGVDITTYLYNGKLSVFNKEGKKIKIKDLRV